MNQAIELLRQYAFLFGIFTCLAGVLGVAFKIYKAAHDRETRILKDRIEELELELKKALTGGDPELLEKEIQELREKNGQLNKQLGVGASDVKILQESCDRLRDERDCQQQKVDALTAELEKKSDDLDGLERLERRRERLVRRALKLEGKIWERSALRHIPPFRPLHERHAAIISVVNLKGGVGKTTVTAHLAMSLSSRGYRVLMVDLDLQGSLSTLFVHESELEQHRKDGRLLQHFLSKVTTQRKVNLLEFCLPVLEGSTAIVPATDSLGYAEAGLTMQWHLQKGKRDVRFLLRRGLHQKRITGKFDIVLLDCPPIFNACCLNALAASDYVLVPAVPSKSAASRLPYFLNLLEKLKPSINPHIQVLGALLNRTHGHQLTEWETDLWQTTLIQSQNVWKLPIYNFETSIRQTNEVRNLENDFTRPEAGSELHGVFSRIVNELEARLPSDCRRIPNPIG